MRKMHVIILVAIMLLFCGCGVMEIFQINEDMVQEAPSGEEQELDFGEEQEFPDIAQNQEKLYIGEYLDYDNAEPNLVIAKGEDGKLESLQPKV